MNFTLRRGSKDRAWYGVCQFKDGDRWRTKEKKLGVRTKKEAKEALKAWAETIELGSEPSPSVIDYAHQVIADKLALHAILPASASDYRKSIAAWAPYLADIKLASVTRKQIEAGLKEMLRSLSPNTVLKRYVALNMALSHAVEVGDLGSNPMDGIPRPAKAAPEQNPLSREEVDRVKRLLADIPQQPWTVAVLLCLKAGLRAEEAAALQLGDIDLEHRRGWVRRAIGYGAGGSYVAPTKSKRTRDFTISDELAAELERWIRQHDAEKPSDWLLGSERYPDARKLGRKWSNFCDLCGIEGIAGRKPTLHDLRHTFATGCIREGMDVKTLQSLLGHASAAITLDVYASADADAKAASATIIDKAV